MTLQISGQPNLVVSRSTLTGFFEQGAGTAQVAMDLAGNSYIVSYGNAHLTKYNKDLVAQWSKKLSTNLYLDSVVVDPSSGYIYTGGFSSTNVYDICLIKWDSSGNIIWQKNMPISGSQVDNTIALDPSGYIYLAGSIIPGSYEEAYILKFDPSGKYVWNVYLTVTSPGSWRYSSLVYNPTSAYLLATGWVQNGPTSGSTIVTANIDSSGNIGLINQVNFAPGGFNFYQNIDTHVDSSGNIYLTGYGFIGSQYYTYVAKIQFGSVVWFKTQYWAGFTNVAAYASYGDSDGNIYIQATAYNSGSTTLNMYVVKYNSSGTVVWQKAITSASTKVFSTYIKVYNSYVYLYYLEGVSSDNLAILKFPDSASSFTQTESGSGLTITDANLNFSSLTPSSYGAASGLTSSVLGGISVTNLSVTTSDSGLLTGASTATVAGSVLNSMSMSQINTENGVSANTSISLSASTQRSLSYVSSGAIKLSNFYGKGFYTYDYVYIANYGLRNDTTSAGTTESYSWTIPTGVTQVIINAVAGGGFALAYHDGGHGEHAITGQPGGGILYLSIKVVAGDVISGVVGQGGGAGYYNGVDTYGFGGAGGNTTIYYNGTLVATCTPGGAGGWGTLGNATLNSGNGAGGVAWSGTVVQGTAASTLMNASDGNAYAYNPWDYIDSGPYGETTANVGSVAITPPQSRLGLGQYPGWVKITNIYGTPKRVSVTVTITASVNNYVANTAKITSYIPGYTDVTFVINSGVIIGATSPAAYAFTIPATWSSGDTITVTNNGKILGAGGAGGSNFGAGGAGGPAIYAARATTINNGSGIIGGGGGGGSGNSYTASVNKTLTVYGGGGGGGGQGQIGGSGASGTSGSTGGSGKSAYNYTGGSGSDGTATAAGTGGASGGSSATAGGNGGTLGSAGSASYGAGGAGGAALVGKTYVNGGAGINTGSYYGGQS